MSVLIVLFVRMKISGKLADSIILCNHGLCSHVAYQERPFFTNPGRAELFRCMYPYNTIPVVMTVGGCCC